MVTLFDKSVVPLTLKLDALIVESKSRFPVKSIAPSAFVAPTAPVIFKVPVPILAVKSHEVESESVVFNVIFELVVVKTTSLLNVFVPL